MEKYKSLVKQWFFTKIIITFLIFIATILIGILGVIREMFIELIAAQVSLFVAWFLFNYILDMVRPVPPVMMIPMPKEKKDDTTEN